MGNCLIERYLNSLASIRRAENTIESYGRFLKTLSDFLNNEYGTRFTPDSIGKVKGYMLNEFLTHRSDLSDSSRNIYVAYMKTFFKFCMDNDYIQENPTRALRQVKTLIDEVEDEQRMSDNLYTADDVHELLSNVGKRNGKRNKAMVALILGTGLRVSELCSLNLGDIRNMQNNTFPCRRKGGGRYRVALASFTKPYLFDHMQDFDDCGDDHPLFITEQGMRMNRISAYRTISSIQKTIGKATGVHRLRHAFLSELNNACENNAVVRDVASHRSLQTTSGYVHSTLEQRADAVSRLSWA